MLGTRDHQGFSGHLYEAAVANAQEINPVLGDTLGKTPTNFRRLAAKEAFRPQENGRAVPLAPGGGPLFPGTNWHGRSAMNLSLNSCPHFGGKDMKNPEADVSVCFNSIRCLQVFAQRRVWGMLGQEGLEGQWSFAWSTACLLLRRQQSRPSAQQQQSLCR